MGDQGGKPEGRAVPGGLERAFEILRPLAVKGIAAARAMPSRTRKLIERADLPRRQEQVRIWVEERDFPASARKLADTVMKRGLAAADLVQKKAAAATASLGPVVAALCAGLADAVKSLAVALSRRSAGLIAILNDRRSVAARKAETRKVGKSSKTVEPVPSELMRLLKEEGVEVDGMDVREALPEPVRPMPVQGVLPLFAEETSPLPGKNR